MMTNADYAAVGRAAYDRGLTIQQMSELARTISDDHECGAYMLGYLAARADATGEGADLPMLRRREVVHLDGDPRNNERSNLVVRPARRKALGETR